MKSILSKIKFKIIPEKKEKIVIPCIEGQYLDNRAAIITGGSSGIGYAIAESFLKNGASVIITGRNIAKLENAKIKLCESVGVSWDCVKVAVLDISKVFNLENEINRIFDEFGLKIDILVNNAGVNCGELFPKTSEADYDKILDTNLKGMYFISQAVAKYMVDKKIKGNILNITSSSSLRPAISPYIISKWGERGLTLGLAKKYLPHGIVVNGLAPGSTLTPMLNKNQEHDNLNLEHSPSKRYIAPEEIANMATILVSSMGRMIVGDTIYMTGGAGVITFDDMVY